MRFTVVYTTRKISSYIDGKLRISPKTYSKKIWNDWIDKPGLSPGAAFLCTVNDPQCASDWTAAAHIHGNPSMLHNTVQKPTRSKSHCKPLPLINPRSLRDSNSLKIFWRITLLLELLFSIHCYCRMTARINNFRRRICAIYRTIQILFQHLMITALLLTRWFQFPQRIE